MVGLGFVLGFVHSILSSISDIFSLKFLGNFSKVDIEKCLGNIGGVVSGVMGGGSDGLKFLGNIGVKVEAVDS